jgi:tetratricopeptide (TPR) repeat protein
VFSLCLMILVLPVVAQENGKSKAFKKAKNLFEKEQYQEAIPLFKEVIKESPKKADEAGYFLGMCQLKLQDYQSAADSFSKALKLREDDYPQALRGRAEALMGLKNYDAAVLDLKKALASSPDDADILYQLGLAEYYKENYNEAIIHLKKVVDARPQDAQAHYFTGWVYYKLKQYDQTIREFEIYVKLCPDCPEAEKIKEILKSLKG